MLEYIYLLRQSHSARGDCQLDFKIGLSCHESIGPRASNALCDVLFSRRGYVAISNCFPPQFSAHRNTSSRNSLHKHRNLSRLQGKQQILLRHSSEDYSACSKCFSHQYYRSPIPCSTSRRQFWVFSGVYDGKR